MNVILMSLIEFQNVFPMITVVVNTRNPPRVYGVLLPFREYMFGVRGEAPEKFLEMALHKMKKKT